MRESAALAEKLHSLWLILTVQGNNTRSVADVERVRSALVNFLAEPGVLRKSGDRLITSRVHDDLIAVCKVAVSGIPGKDAKSTVREPSG